MLGRAFDKTVRRKPLAGAADAGCYGNSIDFSLEVIAKTGVAERTLLLMLIDVLLPQIHLRHPSADSSIMQERFSDVCAIHAVASAARAASF